jgi:hypothetical protein
MILLIVVSYLALLTSTFAGEFSIRSWTSDDSPSITRSELIFSGEIEDGDDDKLVLAIKSTESEISKVKLNSNGGRLTTAIKMGEIVRQLLLTTEAPIYFPDSGLTRDRFCRRPGSMQTTECVCASACFFIWAAGIKRSGFGVAVHRPYLTDDDLRSTTLGEISHAYGEASDLSRIYLRGMGIDELLIDMMFRADPQALHYISPEDLSPMTGKYIPAVADWLAARCGTISASDHAEFIELAVRNTPSRQYRPERFQQLLAQERLKSDCEFRALGMERSKRLHALLAAK